MGEEKTMKTLALDGEANHMAVIVVLMLMLTFARCASAQPAGTGATEAPTKTKIYTTAKELYEAVEPFFSIDPRKELGTRAPETPDDEVLFVVTHLGSDIPEVREMAAELLVKLADTNWRPRQKPCMKYLSREYPLNVRLAALAMARTGYWDRKDFYVDGASIGTEAVLKPHALALFKDVANAPTTPRLLYALPVARTFGTGESGYYLESLTADEQRMLVRRVLASLSTDDAKRRGRLLAYVAVLDEDLVGQEVEAWYRLEPNRDVREWLFTIVADPNPKGWGWNTPQRAARMRQLAAQDTDWRIAEMARKHLQKR